MKILIVDDQKAVADGLRDGIEWKNMGFESVFAVYDAEAAREIFRKYDISVLLCDIQMPVESGISLVRWVRENQYETVCIFLTAQSEFEYAKEAIQLDSFDYIIQPAPYYEIVRVVQKAADRFLNNEETRKLKDIAEQMIENADSIRERIVSGYIFGTVDKSPRHELKDLNVMEGLLSVGYAAVIQIIRWKASYDIWEPELLQYVLNNITVELSESFGQESFLFQMEDYMFLCVLIGRNGRQMNGQESNMLFGKLKHVFEEFTRCDLAVYVDEFSGLEELPDKKGRLLKMVDENVSLENNIFLYNAVYTEPKAAVERFPEFWNWNNHLKSGYFETTKAKIIDYLDVLMQKKLLTKEVLMRLYQLVSQMYYLHFYDKGISPYEVYHTDKELAVINKGASSVECFKEMLSLMTRRCEELQEKNDVSEENIIDMIKEYVQKNMDKNIRISDVSDAVHLSTNYTSKLFRKYTGRSLKEYIIEEKMNVAEALLKTTNLSVSMVSATVGYDNFSHFSTLYRRIKGISPSNLKKIQNNREK